LAFQKIELWQNRQEFTTNNLHVAAKIQSNALSNKLWAYSADAYFYLAGYNQNDWKVSGKFAYNFEKYGQNCNIKSFISTIS